MQTTRESLWSHLIKNKLWLTFPEASMSSLYAFFVSLLSAIPFKGSFIQ